MELDRSARFVNTRQLPIAMGRFETLEVEADAARKLKRFDTARAAIDQMKRWLDENPGDYSYLNTIYLTQSARLAEAEGRKLDALTYYESRFSLAPPTAEEKTHVAALWKEMGGTTDGFRLWSSLRQPQKPAIASEVRPWTELNKPLSALNALDVNGRSWTIADLKGKTTLIDVWATWCVPCRQELPDVEKLYEQVKDRQDIQVISMDIDDNPGDVGPFLKQNHYTFPVILAESLVDDMVPGVSIPRTWIVDSKGDLRLERIGYNPKEWPQEIRDKLTTLK